MDPTEIAASHAAKSKNEAKSASASIARHNEVRARHLRNFGFVYSEGAQAEEPNSIVALAATSPLTSVWNVRVSPRLPKIMRI